MFSLSSLINTFTIRQMLNIPVLWNQIWFLNFFQELTKTISISFRLLTIHILCLSTCPGSGGTGLEEEEYSAISILLLLPLLLPPPPLAPSSPLIAGGTFNGWPWTSYWGCATYPSLPQAPLDSLGFSHLSFYSFMHSVNIYLEPANSTMQF